MTKEVLAMIVVVVTAVGLSIWAVYFGMAIARRDRRIRELELDRVRIVQELTSEQSEKVKALTAKNAEIAKRLEMVQAANEGLAKARQSRQVTMGRLAKMSAAEIDEALGEGDTAIFRAMMELVDETWTTWNDRALEAAPENRDYEAGGAAALLDLKATVLTRVKEAREREDRERVNHG